MDIGALRNIGLTDNEIKIYLDLLESGSSTAYNIGKRTGIYRVHIYDKLEQLMDKGLVTYVYNGPKKFFQATGPSKIKQYLEDRRKEIEDQEGAIKDILPQLEALANLPKEDTFVEVFKGKEGLKYCLKDMVKTGKEILGTALNEQNYNEAIPITMAQYFRDLKRKHIKERIISVKRKGVFVYDKKLAPTTTYRFLEATQFNPVNTAIYGDKVLIITWGAPITAVMIKNKDMAETYRNHFEHLWKAASKSA